MVIQLGLVCKRKIASEWAVDLVFEYKIMIRCDLFLISCKLILLSSMDETLPNAAREHPVL